MRKNPFICLLNVHITIDLSRHGQNLKFSYNQTLPSFISKNCVLVGVLIGKGIDSKSVNFAFLKKTLICTSL